jgi:hypothetical protein
MPFWVLLSQFQFYTGCSYLFLSGSPSSSLVDIVLRFVGLGWWRPVDSVLVTVWFSASFTAHTSVRWQLWKIEDAMFHACGGNARYSSVHLWTGKLIQRSFMSGQSSYIIQALLAALCKERTIIRLILLWSEQGFTNSTVDPTPTVSMRLHTKRRDLLGSRTC